MKKITLLFITMLLVMLAACGGNVQSNNDMNDKTIGMEADDSANQEPAEDMAAEVSGSVKMAMLIAPELVDCEGGAGPQKCMRVKFGDDEDWKFFYSHIEGFDYEPGYRYSLLIEQVDVENPPADGSSLKYVLVEVISQEEVLMEGSGKLDEGAWKLLSMGSESKARNIVKGGEATFQYDPETGQVSGSTGCNNYFGPVDIDPETNTMSFGMIGMTRMACRGDLNQQEIDFMQILESVTHFSVEENRLVLYTEGEEVLVFEPAE